MITNLVSDGVVTKLVDDVNESTFKIHGRTLADVLRSEREYYARRLESENESATKNFEAAEKLTSAGLATGFMYATSIHVELEPKQIPAYVRVLGSFVARSKEPIDGTDDEILVTLTSKAYPTVSVSYKRAVKPTDKCRVVTEVEPAHARRYVACSI